MSLDKNDRDLYGYDNSFLEVSNISALNSG
jgi:hypothetical protein